MIINEVGTVPTQERTVGTVSYLPYLEAVMIWVFNVFWVFIGLQDPYSEYGSGSRKIQHFFSRIRIIILFYRDLNLQKITPRFPVFLLNVYC